eukprot:1192446-Prorocentrum_minimum.AAC.1
MLQGLTWWTLGSKAGGGTGGRGSDGTQVEMTTRSSFSRERGAFASPPPRFVETDGEGSAGEGAEATPMSGYEDEGPEGAEGFSSWPLDYGGGGGEGEDSEADDNASLRSLDDA